MKSPLVTAVDTSMDGSAPDPAPTAKGLPVTEVGIERDGFRGNSLVINAVGMAAGVKPPSSPESAYVSVCRSPTIIPSSRD